MKSCTKSGSGWPSLRMSSTTAFADATSGWSKGQDLHEVAAHRDGVFPHHEVLGQLFDGVDLVVGARDGRVDVGQAHLEVAALVPQVVAREVHDGAAIARVFLEQQGVHLDVGQNALAVLAQALGHQLLDPQTQNAAALLREERELVASLQVVVVQKRCQADGRVVDGVLAALALGVDGVRHELFQVDAHERRRQQAEHGQRGEAPAHGGLAGEHRGHPSSRAWRSSMEPGSVMATRCCTSSSSLMRSATASRTARRARRGSMVPPLFDEITNSVVSGFASAKMARTRTGESESSVLNVIFDESGLLYFVMVMGACVEPPWPMSTTVFSPWAMIESA